MKAIFAVFVSASLAIGCALPEEDIATTEIYTHVLDDRLKALVLHHHPLTASHTNN